MISLRPRMCAATALALTLGFAAPAAAQGERGLLDQLFGNSERMSGRGEPVQEVQGSQAELVVRIERLEAQIRQLTGANEQLQYRNRQLEAQIQSMGGVPGQMQSAGPGASARPTMPAAPPVV